MSLTNEDSIYIENITNSYGAMMSAQECIDSVAEDESDENVSREMNKLWNLPLEQVVTATYYMLGQIIELRRTVYNTFDIDGEE